MVPRSLAAWTWPQASPERLAGYPAACKRAGLDACPSLACCAASLPEQRRSGVQMAHAAARPATWEVPALATSQAQLSSCL